MAGKIYAVSHDGVIALKTMSAAIVEAAEAIVNVSKAIRTVIDDNHDVLGPHENSIIEAVEEIETLVKGASEPVNDISESLNGIADEYNEIIGDDRISHIRGN